MKKILQNNKKKVFLTVFLTLILFLVWELLVPRSLAAMPESLMVIEKGSGYKDIASQLKEQGIIKNQTFFAWYVLASGNYAKLQAGKYTLSSSTPVWQVVKKITTGDTAKQRLRILEGWNVKDISAYLAANNVYAKEDFTAALQKDFSQEFVFLRSKPKKLPLEGYIFPDTYYVAEDTTPEEFLRTTLGNFDAKLTPELRQEIAAQKKSIYQIITMASMLEKEVRSLEDKKIVAGILFKRLEAGMPLQVDATVNYVTGRRDAKVAIKDTKIQSLYNTYQNPGLPIGPISNPGMESILAAVYPTQTKYWYYLSADGTGKTIFSKTFADHQFAMAKYFQ